MEKIMVILAFVGDWLLFSFPLYQGLLELTEQKKILNRLEDKKDVIKAISPWLWLLPLYKIFLEKKRAIQIIQLTSPKEKEVFAMIRYFDKATAWFYVSIAGVLKGFVSTFEVLNTYHVKINVSIFILINVCMVILGLGNALYRLSNLRNSKMVDKVSILS